MDERLNEINRELKELNEALARQGRMEAQWKDLQDQRAERDRRVMETGRVFRKEQDDVDRLEKGGLRALLLSLTGDREVRLSKERREALAAKLQYDQAQRDLEDLDGRIGVLLREKDGLRIDRIRRDALLEEKGELLKALGGETGARLARLDQQLDELEPGGGGGHLCRPHGGKRPVRRAEQPGQRRGLGDLGHAGGRTAYHHGQARAPGRCPGGYRLGPAVPVPLPH